jgi:hypothetical protein
MDDAAHLAASIGCATAAVRCTEVNEEARRRGSSTVAG